MKVIYIAGPYMGIHKDPVEDHIAIEQNVLNAKAAMIEIARHGVGVFCPHMHSHGAELFLSVHDAYWYVLDVHFLKACDAVLRLPGESQGADHEVITAEMLGLPVFHDIDEAINWAKGR